MKQRGFFIVAALASILLTGVAVAVTAQPSAAQGPPARVMPFDSLTLAQGWRMGPGGPGAFGLPFLRELNLTDGQKEQVKQIRESHRAEFEQLATQMHQLHEKVQTEIAGVLTAEQQAKLKELRARRGFRFRH